MNFTHDQLSRIPHILSEPRFTTYLKHANNDRLVALHLYQWNIEVSAALIVPLHLVEVSLRNAVVEILEAVHTHNWPWNQGFIRRLPNPLKGYSPQRNLVDEAQRHSSMGKVVAELKFVFWQKMFTARHDERLWNHHLRRVFPNAPSSMTVAQLREQIYADVEIIRQLRNRIAHHEPIFTRDLAQEYRCMLKIITWRDQATADWLDHMQAVTALLPLNPTAS